MATFQNALLLRRRRKKVEVERKKIKIIGLPGESLKRNEKNGGEVRRR